MLRNINKIFAVLLTLILLTQPAQAYAWWGRSHHEFHHDYHPYPRNGGVELSLTDGLISLFVGGSRYYYCDGVYYTRGRYGYVVVVPPPGAVIRDIPPYYQPIIINGVPYYTSDGIYYQYTPRGYVVVPQPGVTVVQPAPAIAPAVQTQNIVKSQSTVQIQGTE